MTQGNTPPGWYDDGQGSQRWFDGRQWTDQVQPAAAPGPPAPPAQPAQHAQPAQPSYGPPHGGYPQQHQPQPGWGPPPSSGGGMGKGLLWTLIGGGVVVVAALAVVLALVFTGDDDKDDNAGGGGGGGGGDTSSGPSDIVTDYLVAGSKLDFETVCDLSASEDVQEDYERYDVSDCAALGDAYDEQLASTVGDFGDYLPDIETEVTIDDVEEDGDTASVDYTTVSRYVGDDPEGFKESFSSDTLEETTSGTLELAKEDGEWKVRAPDGPAVSGSTDSGSDEPAPAPSAVTPS